MSGTTCTDANMAGAPSAMQSMKSASMLMLEQLTSKTTVSLEPVGNKRKRSLADLRQIVWEKEQAIQKSLKATKENILQQHERNREKSCCLVLDCIRNICKMKKMSVFKLSDLLRTLLEYKALVDMLSIDDPKKKIRVELKELIYRLVELVPEFLSLEDHANGTISVLKGDVMSGPLVQRESSTIGVSNETLAKTWQSKAEPQIYVRVNLTCSYSGLRSKVRELIAAAEAKAVSTPTP